MVYADLDRLRLRGGECGLVRDDDGRDRSRKEEGGENGSAVMMRGRWSGSRAHEGIVARIAEKGEISHV